MPVLQTRTPQRGEDSTADATSRDALTGPVRQESLSLSWAGLVLGRKATRRQIVTNSPVSEEAKAEIQYPDITRVTRPRHMSA